MNSETQRIKQDIFKKECQVCGHDKTNWYYGVIACEACKKFFMRSHKENHFSTFECSATSSCTITVTSRTRCQRCRYDKCIAVGMNLNSKPPSLQANTIIKNSMCVICGAKSSGIHFGVFSCEACKTFFSRSLAKNSHKQYQPCTEECIITYEKRACRYCRFKKCIDAGMHANSTKMGRQPNIFKQEIFNQIERKSLSTKHKLEHESDQSSKRFKLEHTPNDTYEAANTSSAYYSFVPSTFPHYSTDFINYSMPYAYSYNMFNPNYQANVPYYAYNDDSNSSSSYLNATSAMSFSSTSTSSHVNQDELNEIDSFLNNNDWNIRVTD